MVACSSTSPAPAQLFSHGAEPIVAATIDGTVPRATGCDDCHEDEVAAWRRSRHAVSFTNPMFQASFADAWLPRWCLNCHLPLAQAQADRKGALVAEGVTCAACHIRDGALLVAEPLGAWGRSEHPNAVVEPRLRQSEFCAGCHQFDGPTKTHPVRFAGDPVQDTWGEWERMEREGRTCQDCHMPGGKHSFAGAHDRDTVAGAVEVVAAPGRVTVRTTSELGHALPTGDPFRRLELVACGATCDTPVRRRMFGVTHKFVDGEMRVDRDTRLTPPGGPGPSSATLDLPAEATGWELRLIYGEDRLTPHLPPEEVALVIASGPR